MMRFILICLLSICSLSAQAQGPTVNWNTVQAGTFSTTTTSRALSWSSVVGWTNSSSFSLISATRNAGGTITSGSVQWPDGSTGAFTTDTISSACSGAIDAYHVTYVPVTGTTVTVTQAAVTRNSGCAVVAQPVPTVH